MSRVPAGDVIVERPSNNVYTVLVIAAFLAQLIAFLAILTRAGEIFAEGKGLFS